MAACSDDTETSSPNLQTLNLWITYIRHAHGLKKLLVEKIKLNAYVGTKSVSKCVLVPKPGSLFKV